MKIRILSDLHIEFEPFEIPPADADSQSVLVLAGDIGVIRKRSGLEAFLRNAAQQFKAVIYVLGNHEYYAGLWPNDLQQIRAWGLPNNVHIVERNAIEIDDIAFLCSTLWTDFEGSCLNSMQASSKMLNDYSFIKTNPEQSLQPRNMLPEDQLYDHKKSLAWLDETLAYYANTNKRCVVVTHHGLSKRSIHSRFANSNINGAFVSSCDWLLEKHKPPLAIHGHVHNSFDYYVGNGAAKTRVIVNPRGYTLRNGDLENPEFDPLLTINL